MCEHLAKAKGALAAAREAKQGTAEWLDLLHVAQVQALVSIAESLQTLAARAVHA